MIPMGTCTQGHENGGAIFIVKKDERLGFIVPFVS